MALPEPHNNYDLVQGGFDRFAADKERKKAEQLGNQPIDESMQAWVEELQKPGSDPAEVAARARQHPEIQKMMQEYLSRKKGLPQPGAQVPDVSMQGGQPSLSAPGSVNPAGGPQGPAPQGQPSPQDAPASGGYLATPGTGYDQPPPQYQPRQFDPRPGEPGSLGAINAQSHANTTEAAGMYNPPTLSGGPSTQGMSLGSLGQNAPQVSPQQAQDSALNPQPGGGAQMPRQNFANPADVFHKDKHRMTRNEFNMVAPNLPHMIDARSRERVASTGADTQTYKANLSAEKGMLQQVMKSSNVDDATQAKIMGLIEGQDDTQQRFAVKMAVELMKSQNSLEGALGSAKIRAGTPKNQENPDEKRLRNLESRITALKTKTRWEAQPDLKDMVSEFEAEADATAQRLGKPRQRTLGAQPQGTPQPSDPAPAPGGGQPKPPPAKKPSAPAGPPAGKVKVKLSNGQVGYIVPGEFNPKTMQKL